MRFITFLFVLMALVPAAHAGTTPDLVLEGTVRPSDLHHYIERPFAVPPGVTRLTVEFARDGASERTVIDMGILDPERLRGWSGGDKSGFTLSETDATPGYLPGPVVKGRWRLLMGVPNIRAGVTTHYTAKIYFGRGDVPPLREGAGWYRGDLHMHTANSDGKCASRAGVRVQCPVFLTLDAADRRGLDFIVVTDHNTTSHADALKALQPYFDRTLLIPGRELTTFEGHANALGSSAFIDFRLDGHHVRDADALIAATHRAGALFSINHPAIPSGEACMGCGWTARIADWTKVDAVEVVNGGTMRATGAADGSLQGFAFWQALLDKGLHPTAVGGSDNHDALRPLEETGSVGSPTTVVHAASLSEPAILDGIRAGHVFVDVTGSRDRHLECELAGAAMGDHVKLAPGQGATLHLHVTGVPGGGIELVHDAGLKAPAAGPGPLQADDTRSFEIAADGQRHWLYARVLDGAGHLVLVGNPIYLDPE
ncbi:MAG TPA: CehA/McbA family metallohydrolase [Rhizomicrobium sp.]|nr:CehA/McbA family metallohydrolase [Rhizomicrobium sp.]